MKTGLGAVAVGLAAGLIGLLLWRDVRSEVAPRTLGELQPVTAPPFAAAVDDSADIALLREVLIAEIEAREELMLEVEALREELAELRTASERASAARSAPRRFRSFRQERFDEERLREAGLDPGRAAELRRAYEASRLDLLAVRDQVMREGWAGGGGGMVGLFQSGMVELFQARAGQTAALQGELGLEMYDLMLFGAGEPNRVVVRDVLPGSNAEAGGLLPGDVIRSYNDQPVFRMQELRYFMSQSDSEVPVDVRVDRDGLPTTVRLSPGPIGIRMRPALRQPDIP